MDDRDLSDDENGMQMPAMDGSEAFHQVVKDMLVNGHQVRPNLFSDTPHHRKIL